MPIHYCPAYAQNSVFQYNYGLCKCGFFDRCDNCEQHLDLGHVLTYKYRYKCLFGPHEASVRSTMGPWEVRDGRETRT